MRIYALCATVVLAVPLFACSLPPEEISGTVTELRDCMRKALGDDGLLKMQQRNVAMAKQLQALCKSGDVVKAKEFALDFAVKNHGSKEHGVVRACVDAYAVKHKGNAIAQPLPGTPEFTARAEHVCEQLH